MSRSPLLGLALSIGLMMACDPGGSSDGLGPDGGFATVCVPGSTQLCLCAGRVDGAQTCDLAGTRWLACDCGAAPPDVASGDLSDGSADDTADGDVSGTPDGGPQLDIQVPPDAGGATSLTLRNANGAVVTGLNVSHSFGTSTCPQLLGTLTAVNYSPSPAKLEVVIQGAPFTIAVTPVASVSVAAGASVKVELAFNCLGTDSVDTTVEASLGSGASQTTLEFPLVLSVLDLPGAVCTNAADYAILRESSTSLDTRWSQALGNCFFARSSACGSDWFESYLGVSASCSSCFGESLACAFDSCFDECLVSAVNTGTAETASCAACLDVSGCRDAFLECSGFAATDACASAVCEVPAQTCANDVATTWSSQCFSLLVDATCTAPKSTNSPCPLGTVCDAGACVADSTPCDPNPCTATPAPDCAGNTARTYASVGTCTEAGGLAQCAYPVTSTTVCPASNPCVAGVCKSDPKAYQYWAAASVVTSLSVASQGCCFDLDGDGKSDNGLETMLSFFAQVGEPGDIQSMIAQAIADGSLILLFEHRGLQSVVDQASFQLNTFLGKPLSTMSASFSGLGEFKASLDSFNPQSGAPNSSLAAKLTKGLLSAGPGTGEMRLRVRATTSPGANGSGVTMSEGQMGGAVPIQTLADIYNASVAGCSCLGLSPGVPMFVVVASDPKKLKLACSPQFYAATPSCTAADAEICGAYGDNKSLICPAIGILPIDFDSDGDGKKDSMSFGLEFEAVSAKITGWY